MRKFHLGRLLVLMLVFGSLSGAALAAVSGTGGSMTVVSPPSEVLLQFSDTSFSTFAEKQAVLLSSPLAVDATDTGSYGGPGPLVFSPGAIPTGTVVNSQFIHLLTSDILPPLTGSVTFDSDVLGLIFTNENLNSSDAIVGLATVVYPFGNPGRKMIDGADEDIVTLSADRRTVTVSAAASPAYGDEVRVITAVAAATPVTADDCKNGGWKNLVDDTGRPFKNQGDCVSYVATKGKNGANG